MYSFQSLSKNPLKIITTLQIVVVNVSCVFCNVTHDLKRSLCSKDGCWEYSSFFATYKQLYQFERVISRNHIAILSSIWIARCNSQFITPQADHILGYVLPCHTTPPNHCHSNPSFHHNTKISFFWTFFWSLIILERNIFQSQHKYKKIKQGFLVSLESLVLNIPSLKTSK